MVQTKKNTVYIAEMCCAVEGNLAVDAIMKVDGVKSAVFNLRDRTVDVEHATDVRSLMLALEAAGLEGKLQDSQQAQHNTSTFYIPEMCCAVEGNLAVDALKKLTGVQSAIFNLRDRTVDVEYTADTADLLAALHTAGLEAKLQKRFLEKKRTRFEVQGLDNDTACEIVTRSLNGLDVSDITIDTHTQMLTAVMTLEVKRDVIDRLAASGFNASEVKEAVLPAHKTPWVKLGIAGAFALASEACHWFEAPDETSLVLALIAIALAGLSTYRRGLLALRHLNFNMNALMSVAVTGAVMIGNWPEAAMVMVLFEVSEAIEGLSIDRAHSAIDSLLKLTPETATIVLPSGQTRSLAVDDIVVGDRIRTMPGERIALDGVILTGTSSVNQSAITGEALPVEKNVGDKVFGGTLNQTAELEIEVMRDAQSGLAAKMLDAVEAANRNKAPTERFVDVFARYYTPAVFVVALLTVIVSPVFFGGEWLEWLYRGLVVLVIACPCALVISTPVTIVSALAVAARKGLIIKGGAYLEEARKLKFLALDKTGTITQGRPQVIGVHPFAGVTTKELLTQAASLSSRSNHPVSTAITQAALADGITVLPVKDFATVVGVGTHGKVNGALVSLKNPRAHQQHAPLEDSVKAQIANYESQGASVVIISDFFGPLGMIAVSDTIRAEANAGIRAIKNLGIEPVLLTGDNPQSARFMAQTVGIDEVHAQMLPEDKLQLIEKLKEKGPVAMVGDGINDAPALAQADIGIAMGKRGSDIAIDAAAVTLMDDDLNKLGTLVKLSKLTHNRLVQNITIALGIKFVFFVLAYLGMACMWMAVFADIGTCLIVVAWGLMILQSGKRL